MNDPWDVKSVRQFGQYVSCMKINGVPLLPPLLSLECRKEMQYYKLLAKEIEKRVLLLRTYSHDVDSDSSEQQISTVQIDDETYYEHQSNKANAGFTINTENISSVTKRNLISHEINSSLSHNTKNNILATDNKSGKESPNFVIDLSLRINEEGHNVLQPTAPVKDMPEHDYDSCRDSTNKIKKNSLCEIESRNKDIVNISLKVTNKECIDKYELLASDEYPSLSSISTKTFTGSLNDIHIESKPTTLIRQRSYTVLNPSPQLLAHLEYQASNRGVNIDSISMSESQCSLSSPMKKRKSWDLQTAKEKWSSMALELNHNKNISHKFLVSYNTSKRTKPASKSPTKLDKEYEKTEIKKHNNADIKNPQKNLPPNKATVRKVSPASSPKNKQSKNKCQQSLPASIVQEPAKKIRELYEKMQQQQLKQMAALIEKQKKEQILLQQVFEEQNKMLCNQLKSITPTTVEIKEAWQEKNGTLQLGSLHNQNHIVANKIVQGPVSLSQLINQDHKEHLRSPLSDTNKYISQCDNILKKSKEITSSIKTQSTNSQSQKGRSLSPSNKKQIDSKTRTNSPVRSSTVSRRLKYEGSPSSERDNEPILTDRTNDTLADLNVTFPSDQSDDYRPYDYKMASQIYREEVNNECLHYSDNTIKNLEQSIHKSMRNGNLKLNFNPPTEQESAAATKIVACAKGFLVRRLMKTERVQGIVQTIKDALLCALQLHQDREGIRGADVDLHRRLIQQITAACYSLHDTFVASAPSERCAVLAADRARRRSLALRASTSPPDHHLVDVMSHSFSGATSRRAPSLMTQSNYGNAN